MKNLLLRAIIFVGAVYIASQIVGGISFTGWKALVLTGLLLAVVHSVIKPVIKIITLPLTLITFGLFSLILNAAFFWFVGNSIPGFVVTTFMAAFWGALVVAVANWLFDKIVDNDD